MTVWVCGEALIDLIPVEPGSEQRNAIPGGGPANTAHALARLGIPTEFIGGLSDDEYGRRMRAEFIADGVGLTFTPEHKLPTCLAIVSIAIDGGATYEFKIDGTATFAFEAETLPDPNEFTPDAIYIGTLATIIEPGAKILKDWIEKSKDCAPIIYDPNITKKGIVLIIAYLLRYGHLKPEQTKSVESFMYLKAGIPLKYPFDP
jgi:fructokinase